MRTAGVDLASQSAETAACVLEWPEQGRASVVSLECGVDDARLLEIVAGVDKLGIDVPLGWPRKFARAVARHAATGRWAPGYDHGRDAAEYRLRATDRYFARETRAATGTAVIPLSVSTDRIGVPAMRAAALLSSFEQPTRLDGSGKVIEVYPAGALLCWGFPHRQYKGATEENRSRRARLVADFCAALASSLEVSAEVRQLCTSSDDALDALVAACVARAATVGEVETIPEVHRHDARREGWIALPKRDALARLGTGATKGSAQPPT